MTQHAYHRWCSAILLLLTLIAIVCLWSIKRTGLHIDTNLRSLSPSFSLDAEVNQALNKMSANTAQDFMLVLVNDDEDQLADASDYLRELIETEAKALRYQDQTALLDNYAAQLKQHAFFMLSDQARAALQQQNTEVILKLGEQNLYGSAGMLRLIPVTRDPLGFANDYALGLFDRLGLNAGEDIQSVNLAGTDTATFIAVHKLQLANDALEMNQQDLALASIQKIIEKIKAEYPDVELLESGILFFAADAAQSARADIQTITTGSMIGVLLLILWVFRGPRALLLPVLSIALGLGFAFSLCHYWFGSIHVLTLVFGSSLIGVVVDYALHYFYFQAHHSQSENRLPLYRALFLSLLTSVIGFAALAWSGLAALQQIAIFAALGLVYAWLVVIALGHYLTKNVKAYDASLQALVRAALQVFAKLPSRWVLPLMILILAAGFSFTGFSLPASDNPRSFFAANPELVAQEKQVSEWVASHEPASFILVQGENTQQVYDRIAQVQQLLETGSENNPAALPLLGAHLFFPSPAQQQENYLFNARLYAGENLAAEFIARQELDEISASNLAADYRAQQNQLLNPTDFFQQEAQFLPPLWIQTDTRLNALLLIPKTMDVKQLADKLASVPGASFFSAMQDAENAMKDLRLAALQLLFLALGLMALLLLSRYPLSKTLQLIAIPFFAVSTSILLLALFNIPITLFHVMALFLVVGLGMDYVIFIAEMSENSVETLSAVTLSSATNLLSFGLLSLSILPAVSAFGTALFIGGSLNLVGALLLTSRRWTTN